MTLGAVIAVARRLKALFGATAERARDSLLVDLLAEKQGATR